MRKKREPATHVRIPERLNNEIEDLFRVLYYRRQSASEYDLRVELLELGLAAKRKTMNEEVLQENKS